MNSSLGKLYLDYQSEEQFRTEIAERSAHGIPVTQNVYLDIDVSSHYYIIG
jgi:hypothetical protein